MTVATESGKLPDYLRRGTTFSLTEGGVVGVLEDCFPVADITYLGERTTARFRDLGDDLLVAGVTRNPLTARSTVNQWARRTRLEGGAPQILPTCDTPIDPFLRIEESETRSMCRRAARLFVRNPVALGVLLVLAERGPTPYGELSKDGIPDTGKLEVICQLYQMGLIAADQDVLKLTSDGAEMIDTLKRNLSSKVGVLADE